MAPADGSGPSLAWPALFSIQKPSDSDGRTDFPSSVLPSDLEKNTFSWHNQLRASPRMTFFSDVDGIDPSLVLGTFILQSVEQIFTNI